MATRLLAGRYRLLEILSSTRMAEVWLAVDSELERQVVVKLLAPKADRERFEREARAVAALSHPNIVQLFDFGEEERSYMVFEYLPGGSLEERLAQDDALSGDEVTQVASDLAGGLAHAHDRSVVHRDLKPGNVLFDPEGRSKIADFGIARVQGTDTLTDAGTVLGTAAYISPEQVRGEPATPATDVYAFGVIVYRLLAGRLPFESDSPTELAALHRDAAPPPLPTSSDDDHSRALAAVAMSALAKEPSRRPADGAALLRTFESATPAAAATTQILQTPRPTGRARRHLPLVTGLGALLLAGCGVGAAILLTDEPPPAPAVTSPQQPSHPATKRPSSTVQTATSHPSTNQPQTTPTATTRQTTAPRATTPAAPPTVTTVPSTTTPPTTEPPTTPATTAPTTATP
jgi:eukaryotic-like serine/threonine-protein kinase